MHDVFQSIVGSAALVHIDSCSNLLKIIIVQWMGLQSLHWAIFLREFLDNLVGPSTIFYIPPVNAPLAGNLKLELENEMAAHYWKLDLVENRGQLLLFSACVITPASSSFLFRLSLEQKAWKKFLISFEIINPCLVWLSAAEYHPFTCHCKVWGSARNI